MSKFEQLSELLEDSNLHYKCFEEKTITYEAFKDVIENNKKKMLELISQES